MFWFFRKKVAQAIEKVAAPRPPMNDETLAKALKVFNDLAYNFGYGLNEPWSYIPPVKIITKFAGWGYVQGRTKAIIVNARVALCEADDDMEFSEHCVLLDGVPTLLIMRRSMRTTVTIVAERDFFEEVMQTAAMPMNSVAEFYRLPAPVQKVMHDVIQKIYELYLQVQKTKEEKDPIEQLLKY